MYKTLLYQHANNYAAEHNELPDNAEMADYVEELLVNEAMTWAKIPKIRELLMSEGNNSSGKKSYNRPSKTLNNTHEVSKKVPHNSDETWEQSQDRKRNEILEKYTI